MVASPSVGVNGTVFIGSHDKVLYALEGKTGSVVWTSNLGSSRVLLLLTTKEGLCLPAVRLINRIQGKVTFIQTLAV